METTTCRHHEDVTDQSQLKEGMKYARCINCGQVRSLLGQAKHGYLIRLGKIQGKIVVPDEEEDLAQLPNEDKLILDEVTDGVKNQSDPQNEVKELSLEDPKHEDAGAVESKHVDTKKERFLFFEQHKEDIITDLYSTGRAATIEKWEISNIYSLINRWHLDVEKIHAARPLKNKKARKYSKKNSKPETSVPAAHVDRDGMCDSCVVALQYQAYRQAVLDIFGHGAAK